MRDFPHGDLTIGCPEEWLDASQVILVGPPDESGYSPSLMITREDLEKTVSAEAYAAEQKVGLEGALRDSGYEVLREGEADLDGRKAFEREHAFTPAHLGFAVRQIQVYSIRRGEAVTITATDRADRFAKTEPLLREAISRFRLA